MTKNSSSTTSLKELNMHISDIKLCFSFQGILQAKIQQKIGVPRDGPGLLALK